MPLVSGGARQEKPQVPTWGLPPTASSCYHRNGTSEFWVRFPERRPNGSSQRPQSAPHSKSTFSVASVMTENTRLADDRRQEIAPQQLVSEMRKRAMQIMNATGKKWVIFVEMSYSDQACCRRVDAKAMRAHGEFSNHHFSSHCAQKYEKYFKDLSGAVRERFDDTAEITVASDLHELCRDQNSFVYNLAKLAQSQDNAGVWDGYSHNKSCSYQTRRKHGSSGPVRPPSNVSRTDSRPRSAGTTSQIAIARLGAFEIHLFLARELFAGRAQDGSAENKDYRLLHSKLWSRKWPNIGNVMSFLECMHPEPPRPPDDRGFEVPRILGEFCPGGYIWTKHTCAESSGQKRWVPPQSTCDNCERCGELVVAGWRCKGGTHLVCARCVPNWNK